jgi:antibiotic biosynthesis monooxygenase (ABM) superfamily enzyme
MFTKIPSVGGLIAVLLAVYFAIVLLNMAIEDLRPKRTIANSHRAVIIQYLIMVGLMTTAVICACLFW